MRTDISNLQQNHPKLAKRFNEARELLDAPKSLKNHSQRYDASQILDGVIEKIRNLPGFNRFLLAPSEQELVAMDGPIVMINVSDYGCHALIIQKKGLQSLELPLQVNEILMWANTLINPKLELLEWLWLKVTKPILGAIGYTQRPENWPRVWWIPTGLLAKFPIHAAGRHADLESGETVLDRVISSYSSSVRAITRSRQSVTTASRQKSMVLVGAADTTNHGFLQFVSREIEALAALGKLLELQVKQPIPYQKEILAAIADYEIFHFAGHGHTNSSNPSSSALPVRDGRITVRDLFESNFHKKPLLAYLSACGTGQIKHDGLVDEGLHLIGACQLAGFKHVIGTLWEVTDKSCVDIARDTYQQMQTRKLSNNSVSQGLHYAITKARNRWVEENAEMCEVRHRVWAEEGNGDASALQLSQNAINRLRKIEAVEDSLLNWIQYVHYGS